MGCARAHPARAEVPNKHLHNTHGYWVPYHPPTFSRMRPAVPEIWKRGAHVRTCRCTPPMTCGKQMVNDPKPTHQISTQSAKLFLRCRKAVCNVRTCRDTYPTHDLRKVHSSWPTTHPPNLNTIGQAIPEIRKRSVHVRMCRRRHPTQTFCKI